MAKQAVHLLDQVQITHKEPTLDTTCLLRQVPLGSKVTRQGLSVRFIQRQDQNEMFTSTCMVLTLDLSMFTFWPTPHHQLSPRKHWNGQCLERIQTIGSRDHSISLPSIHQTHMRYLLSKCWCIRNNTLSYLNHWLLWILSGPFKVKEISTSKYKT